MNSKIRDETLHTRTVSGSITHHIAVMHSRCWPWKQHWSEYIITNRSLCDTEGSLQAVINDPISQKSRVANISKSIPRITRGLEITWLIGCLSQRSREGKPGAKTNTLHRRTRFADTHQTDRFNVNTAKRMISRSQGQNNWPLAGRRRTFNTAERSLSSRNEGRPQHRALMYFMYRYNRANRRLHNSIVTGHARARRIRQNWGGKKSA